MGASGAQRAGGAPTRQANGNCDEQGHPIFPVYTKKHMDLAFKKEIADMKGAWAMCPQGALCKFRTCPCGKHSATQLAIRINQNRCDDVAPNGTMASLFPGALLGNDIDSCKLILTTPGVLRDPKDAQEVISFYTEKLAEGWKFPVNLLDVNRPVSASEFAAVSAEVPAAEKEDVVKATRRKQRALSRNASLSRVGKLLMSQGPRTFENLPHLQTQQQSHRGQGTVPGFMPGARA